MSSPTYPPPFPPQMSGDEQIEKVRTGQRCIIFAILLNFGFLFLGMLIPKGDPTVAAIGGLLLLCAALGGMILGILGIVRLGSGLGYSVVARIFIIIGYFIPLVGLIILLALNSQATNALRAAGYHVGFLGAEPKPRY